MNIQGKRILVTGGNGFLGSHVVRALRNHGCLNIYFPRSAEYDLRSQHDVRAMMAYIQPDVVIHLAALVGGIGANMKAPGAFFYDNIIMGVELMEQARRIGVEKFVQIGTTCSYPKFAPKPFKETDIWLGYPEETNAPYGIAKKVLLVQAQAYRQQYGFNVIYLIPTNLYGPHDDFDLEHAHIVPATINKIVSNPTGEVDIWGSGVATRDFLYAADAAEGIVMATERYDSPEPVNLGSGAEVSIKEITDKLAELTGFTGKRVWDKTKPDGQPYRVLDVTRAKEFGWTAKTTLTEGLKETIKWYRENLLDNAPRNVVR